MENNNNRVEIVGIIGTPTFSHETHGEKFYLAYVSPIRNSGTCDAVPCLITEKLVENDMQGKKVYIIGTFRSRNVPTDVPGKNSLELSVLVQSIENVSLDTPDMNEIWLDAFICKQPIHRTTPKGRNITDLLLAVNRSCGRSDYLPCIALGVNALETAELTVGAKVKVHGRIQSRYYKKTYEDGGSQIKIAYEVSSNKVEVSE